MTLAVSPFAGIKAVGTAYGIPRVHRFRFQHDDASLERTLTIPAGTLLWNIGIHTATLFDSGTSDLLDIGDEGDADGYVDAASVAGAPFAAGTTIWLDYAPATAILGAYLTDTATTNVIEEWSNNYYAAEEDLTITITKTGTASTAGDVYVFVALLSFDNDQI